MTQTQKPTSLPRRANTIRSLAASMAERKLRVEGARQVVSDRIGYLFAAVVGGLAFKYYGPPGVYVMILLYFLGALRAYERWKKLDKEDKR
jgi:hypothetical protein